ncbi:MAG TPA: VOC family protein [Isosphaeraceae bacterium]
MELYMVEIQATDWTRSVAWYTVVLGLKALMEDEPRRFTLLDAGPGRIAVVGRREPGAGRADVRLTFRVDDVDVERVRLIAFGVPVGPILENRREGYRQVVLADPDGTPITLFSWAAPSGAAPTRSPREDGPR